MSGSITNHIRPTPDIVNPLYNLKHVLKKIRWQGRRHIVAAKYGLSELNRTPAVLSNAMPKSGSHLIIQVLQGLTRLGPFVNPGFPPVNRDEVNEKLSQAEILDNLRQMKPGDIAYGYLKAIKPFLSLLTQPGRATIFLYRDPRDMIISHIFYASQIHKGHGMNQYYTENLHTMEERINAAIRGVNEPGLELASIRSRYEGYLGWLEQPEVFCIRFEQLILDRKAALAQILDYLGMRGFRSQMGRDLEISILEKAIVPKKSGTFRKGQAGNWREHFTEANKTFFKEQTGDLLTQLNYEHDTSW